MNRIRHSGTEGEPLKDERWLMLSVSSCDADAVDLDRSLEMDVLELYITKAILEVHHVVIRKLDIKLLVAEVDGDLEYE